MTNSINWKEIVCFIVGHNMSKFNLGNAIDVSEDNDVSVVNKTNVMIYNTVMFKDFISTYDAESDGDMLAHRCKRCKLIVVFK